MDGAQVTVSSWVIAAMTVLCRCSSVIIVQKLGQSHHSFRCASAFIAQVSTLTRRAGPIIRYGERTTSNGRWVVWGGAVVVIPLCVPSNQLCLLSKAYSSTVNI